MAFGLAAFATLAIHAVEAQAQTYQYVARTVAPASRSGAVTAGSLTWQCTGSECRISGPWPAPGVSACAALAGQVGRIASYGREGAMLSAEQLNQCNANLPAMLQIDPSVAAQIRPQVTLPPSATIVRPGVSAPAPAATPGVAAPAAAPTQVAIQPGGRPEDMRVYALSGSTIRFFGVTPRLSAPALPEARPMVGTRIDSPAITLQASAPGATPTPRSTTVRAPFYRYGASGAATIRVPISMRDLPAETLGLGLSCTLSRGRYVPSPVDTSPYVALWSQGTGAEESFVAIGEVELQITNINHWEATAEVPMQLQPFQRLEDARSYDCAVRVFVDRVSPPGRLQLMIGSLVTSTSRPGYHPAPGTTPQLFVRGNIQ